VFKLTCVDVCVDVYIWTVQKLVFESCLGLQLATNVWGLQ